MQELLFHFLATQISNTLQRINVRRRIRHVNDYLRAFCAAAYLQVGMNFILYNLYIYADWDGGFVNSNKKDQITENDIQKATAWITDLNIPDLGEDQLFRLKNDYFFAKQIITRETFINEHGGVSIEDWKEAEYLLRDIEVANAVLTGLNYSQRRNALAALNGIDRKKVLAIYLNKSESHIGDFLNLHRKTNSFSESISEFALLFDVMDEQIINDNIHRVSNHFNNYVFKSKVVKVSEFAERVHKKRDRETFVIINDSPVFSASELYGRVKRGNDYISVEIYNLNENSLEINDFSYYLGFKPTAIVITPALLRGCKKVIYYQKLKEKAPDLEKNLNGMSFRRLTVVRKL